MEWSDIEKEFDVEVNMKWDDEDIVVFPYMENKKTVVTLGKFIEPAIVEVDGEKWPGVKIGDDYFYFENYDDLSDGVQFIKPGKHFKANNVDGAKKMLEEIEEKGYIMMDYWIHNFDVVDDAYIEAVQLATLVSDGRQILVAPLLYERAEPWND